MLILNEKSYAKKIYFGINTDIKSLVTKLGYVTRYLLHVDGCSDIDNYNKTVQWASKNHNMFNESSYSNLINDSIKRAHKRPFYDIKTLNITKNELNAIMSLNDLRAEKMLFVLLCMAKQQSVSYGFTNGLVKFSITQLCKEARISVPSDSREYILNKMIQYGLLSYPKKNNSECLIVTFMEDGEPEIMIDELDCRELAYVYLSWKNYWDGYDRCKCCNRIIKQSKSNPRKFCKECSNQINAEGYTPRVIKCVDCGKLVFIDNKKNTRSSRCPNCYSEYRKDKIRENVRKYRDESGM